MTPRQMVELRATRLLFDMDGTLVDSSALVEQTWTDFAAKHRLRADEVIAFAHGRPTRATVHEFLGDHELAAAETARLVAYEETETTGLRQVPGARELLRRLPSHLWAVVTSASRTLAVNRMTAAGVPLPDILISADDITAGKPDPQGYLMAARRLGVEIGECAVFEDSVAGVRAGIASGATTVVVGAITEFDGTLTRIADFADVALDLTGDAVRIAVPDGD
ncbi:HAD-IA family hydrolase [Nocardia arthritidis]|uniref:HAD-IA family hydrolase n=1 Tax=Nocardia arthritidis TaxID=228602 RepID=A0A6G9YEK0_9NOCA|nr:HAD-IA family hydrolase [Nocardia arthritidis]QIS11622.1 HAD-IA family hydrolase [Nocardia arthritidis]